MKAEKIKTASKVKTGVVVLVLVMLIVIQPTVEPIVVEQDSKFVLSSYAVDAYGQGFDGIDAEENSTGSWQDIQLGGGIPSDFNVSYGNFVRFRVDTILNSTLVGASSLLDGKRYFRHNITVLVENGTSVFSQQNFTYYGSSAVGVMYYYIYHIILNFNVQPANIYRAIIMYEVYY